MGVSVVGFVTGVTSKANEQAQAMGLTTGSYSEESNI